MAKVDIISVVNNIVSQNPNVSQDKIKILVQENLKELKSQGSKISPKQMAQANALVDQVVSQNAQLQFTAREANAKTKKVVQKLNTAQAQTRYGKDQQVAISATEKGVVRRKNKKYLDYVTKNCTGEGNLVPQTQLSNKSAKASMEVFTGLKAKDFDLLEGMIDEQHQGAGTFTQHLENLKADGKIAEHDMALAEMRNVDTTPHETSKVRVTKKKDAELKSKAEHKSNKIGLTKEQRDANFATKNGIVRHKNKKYLDYVKETCTGKGDLIPETKLPKSAKQSFEVFEQAGKIVAETIKTETKKGNKILEEAAQTASNILEETAETGIKKAGKLSKYGKVGVIAALVAAAGYTVAEIFGITKKSENPEANMELKLTA